jgi:hypothetical protein
VIALPPQQIDHLAIAARAPSAGRGPGEDSADDRREQARVGHPVDHEARQRLRRVEQDELVVVDGAANLEPALRQAALDGPTMRLDGDDDDRLAVAEADTRKIGDDVAQELVVLVELDDVRRSVSVRRCLELGRSHQSPRARQYRCRAPDGIAAKPLIGADLGTSFQANWSAPRPSTGGLPIGGAFSEA